MSTRQDTHFNHQPDGPHPGLWVILVALLPFLLAACTVRPATRNVTLGPLVQLTEQGNLRLVWWTDQAGTAAVRLDLSQPITVTATSRAWRVNASPPLDRGWQHVADLPPLPPSSKIPYRLLLDGVDLTPGTTFTLHTPPSQPPLRLAVIGDYGAGTEWERQIHDLIAARPPDILLTAGDNAYNRGRYDEFRRRVFAIYGDLMSRIPFMPAIGNHDNDTRHARPYLDLFVLPENAWRPQDRERYYSFDVANAHIVVLDTTDPLLGISDLALDDMADWLAADLAATDKPWRIAVFHHPPYSAGQHGSDTIGRQRLVPVLEQGGVQFVFNGHEHDYQRTCPIRDNQCVPAREGVTYIITGGGGAWLRPTGQDWFTAKAMSVHEVAFLTLDVCTARLEVISIEGEIIDTLSVQRCVSREVPSPCFASPALRPCAA